MYLGEIDQFITKYYEEIIKDLQELVNIPSISDNQENINKAIDCIKSKADKMGMNFFITEERDVCVIEIGTGNETLGILSHLDVVNADTKNENWNHDPFSGKIVDGELWGRGTVDDKGPLIACLYAMYFALLSGKKLHKKVQLILGTQEEVEWSDMLNYVEKYKLPDYGFTPDGEFPVQNIEKGYCDIEFCFKISKSNNTDKIEIIELKAGESVNSVPATAYSILNNINFQDIKKYADEYEKKYSEKIRVSQLQTGIKVSAKGISTHSCQPEIGKNAMNILCKFLSELPLANNGFKTFVSFIIDNFYDDIYGCKIGICDDNEYHNGEFIHKTVICPTMVFPENDLLKVIFNIRVTCKISKEQLISALDSLSAKYKSTYNILDYKDPVYIDRNKPFLTAMVDSYKKITGRNEDFLTAMGTSYAKAMPNIVSWGPVFPEGPDYCHEANERISIDDLLNLIRIYGEYIWSVIFDNKSFK